MLPYYRHVGDRFRAPVAERCVRSRLQWRALRANSVHRQTSGWPAPAVLLSITDDGPGLPADFDPMKQKGLGMKLIQSLTKQIGGTLKFAPGDGERGTRLTVSFTV